MQFGAANLILEDDSIFFKTNTNNMLSVFIFEQKKRQMTCHSCNILIFYMLLKTIFSHDIHEIEAKYVFGRKILFSNKSNSFT
jgi:hypothetical protein